MRFIGDYTAKLDAKGRVFLPAPFRKVLEAEQANRLVLRKDLFQNCLALYPESLWAQLLDMIHARVNPWNGKQQSILRHFAVEADLVELDRNGRFLINKEKLDLVGIKQDVRFLAVDDHIEVWDKKICEEMLKKDINLSEELQNLMADLPPNNL